MPAPIKKHARLGLAGLTMINIAAIANLRDLPQMAEYGWLLIPFYLLAAVFFFVPVSLAAAELASAWPERGGVYVWIREAFGQRWGFIAVFLQWFQNVCWFPVVLTFAAASLAYAVAPTAADGLRLANAPGFVIPVVLGVYWAATLLNLRGLRWSAVFSAVGTWSGVVIPGVLLIVMGLLWLARGEPSQLGTTTAEAMPGIGHFSSLSLAAGVLLAFAGMEMTGAHAREVDRPGRAYPWSIGIATVVILLVFMGGSLAIAVALSPSDYELQSGVVQAIAVMGQRLGWNTEIARMASLLLFIGVAGSVNSWVPGPAKGLLASAQDGHLPRWLCHTNAHDVPVRILLLQAVGVSVACVVFALQSSVQAAYFLLSVLANQLYLIMYVLLFLAVVWLRRTRPGQPRPFRIPGGGPGLALTAGCGLIGCGGAFLIGFFPPTQLAASEMDSFGFVLFLLLGIPLVCLVPVGMGLVVRRLRQQR